MSDAHQMSTQTYLLVKRGLYYRPDAKGYTGIKDEAGRYTFDEVAAYIHSPDMGVDAVLESEAPEYREACWPEVRAEHEAKKLRRLKEENERLKDALLAIIERSRDGELGTSKVIDMRNLAEKALENSNE